MLNDAIAAEAFKLARNRATLFWGFIFTPLVALLVGLFSEVYLRGELRAVAERVDPTRAAEVLRVDLAESLIRAVSQAGGPLTVLFCLMGAATLFAGEYRWETWRLLVGRSGRADLLLSKAAVYAVACAGTVLAIGLTGPLAGLAGALVNGAEVSWGGGDAGAYLPKLLGLFGIVWLQLLQAGAVAALAAVVTRSMMAAVLGPVMLSVVQAFAHSQLPSPDPLAPPVWKLLALPGMAAELPREWLQQLGAAETAIPASSALLGVGAVLAWIAACLGAALVLFLRQDLAKE